MQSKAELSYGAATQCMVSGMTGRVHARGDTRTECIFANTQYQVGEAQIALKEYRKGCPCFALQQPTSWEGPPHTTHPPPQCSTGNDMAPAHAH